MFLFDISAVNFSASAASSIHAAPCAIVNITAGMWRVNCNVLFSIKYQQLRLLNHAVRIFLSGYFTIKASRLLVRRSNIEKP